MGEIFGTIVTDSGLRYPGGPFHIEKRYMNGILVGRAGHCYLACFNSPLRDSVSLRPVVGALNDQAKMGWVWPSTEPVGFTLDDWCAALRLPRMTLWRHLLAEVLSDEDMVHLAIEGYTLDDLNTLRDRAWYEGRSVHAPLWRVYALVPARLWETSSEFPRFDGQVRQLSRFGAIYDPRVHQLKWK